MTEINTGLPAFPFAATDPSNVHMQAQGMTLRDWFAGQALAGLASGHDEAGTWTWTVRDAARTAYLIADAMLEARK